jgi:hypothetical protein
VDPKLSQQNDPRFFSVIDPHFTLVFPVSDFSKDRFIAEVKKEAVGVKKFDFELKVATINQDISHDYYHEFLVPDKGYSDVVKLHDKLYSGLLDKYLRLDIDFIPHSGIGNADAADEIKQRVDTINERGIAIEGVVDKLSVIEYSSDLVRSVESISLE